jgi:hypothetical protein
MNRISEGIIIGTWFWIKYLHTLLIIMAQEWLLYPVGWKLPRVCVLTKCPEHNRTLPNVTCDAGDVTTGPDNSQVLLSNSK